jgi:hypothetical protein
VDRHRRWHRGAEDADERIEWQVRSRAGQEGGSVEVAQFRRQNGVRIGDARRDPAQDRHHRLVLGERGLPFGPYVLRAQCLRADDDHQAVAAVDGVPDLLGEGQRPVGHALPVPPDVEAARAQHLVDPRDERVVVTAGVGQEHRAHAGERRPRRVRSGKASSRPAMSSTGLNRVG